MCVCVCLGDGEREERKCEEARGGERMQEDVKGIKRRQDEEWVCRGEGGGGEVY